MRNYIVTTSTKYIPDWFYEPTMTTNTTQYRYYYEKPRGHWEWVDDSIRMRVPNACANCSNHPANGGDGICHCILGLQDVYY